ncbi:ethanolamine ammonia-lyase subunit EutB [Posidoniimonas polymericola]|uniref:ethanolamine ammonia-lyase subunit EutB n=1 Tax=Posidoniimonas polymericola TaxID=2528002 RepID=UPI0018D28A93|nr:ethanolamine ammonia-lyase subunit EutB [Posidoniimonas polymericola]
MLAAAEGGVVVDFGADGEDLFAYLHRTAGGFDLAAYRRLLGAGNEFKEGDQSEGVAAADDASRAAARELLANTRIGDLERQPVFTDAQSDYIAQAVDPEAARKLAGWTVGRLKAFLLESSEEQIKQIMPGLSSDAIACVVKLCTNDQLIAIGGKVFNPLPGSKVGARGYMGARIQPNSPTDHPEDIRWQVFDGFAYAVGDVVLGTNPVSSEVESVARVEQVLADILETFGIEDVLPHCVLAHIDVQAEVEQQHPGTTGEWFQSLAGVEDAARTFDISVDKMVRHAQSRDGRFALYFETGQGADATNGHGKGFDMVLHESRKYGLARALRQEAGRAQQRAGRAAAPWVHVNDVAGFIGPEVFRNREQLVRCCLEDIVMGKLHGLTIGLDVCSTLHMEVDLDDLDWCVDQIMPACPAYLMALPTKNDPMLSYLTTAFQDHVRVREKFGYKVDDQMWRFFQSLGVIDNQGQPTKHFGDPAWVYLQYRRKQGDSRAEAEILAEAREQMANVRGRGVLLAEGYGGHPWELAPELDRRVRTLYEDSKQCIWAELSAPFAAAVPHAVPIRSQTEDRADYILHPPAGEVLDDASLQTVRRLRDRRSGDGRSESGRPAEYDVQLVISDGLNALSLMDKDHLAPYLTEVRQQLSEAGYRPAPENLLLTGGRVRAGYRIGEELFGSLPASKDARAVLHVIGERPGSGHHAFSVYITGQPAGAWAKPGVTDHNVTRVVSGIADTALPPATAAADTVRILKQLAPLG